MVQGSAEALEQTRPGEWPKRHKVSSWQVRQIHLRQKEKEQRHLFKSAKREVEESQGEQKLRLEREKNQLHREESQVSRRRGRTSKANLPRRKQERMSGCKSFPGRSGESWWNSKSDQT